MTKLKCLAGKYKHFLILLIYIPLLMCFSYCEKVVKAKYIMHCTLDDLIPFVKVFIIPYLSWFVYIGFGFAYSGFKCKNEYYKLCIFMFSGMAICYIIYLLLPNAQNLRPVIAGRDVFSRLVNYIYSVDTPTNVSPSIHVMASVGINTTLSNCARMEKKAKLEWISVIWMLLICLSTLLIKQHSAIDVIFGILLSLVLYAGMDVGERCMHSLKGRFKEDTV